MRCDGSPALLVASAIDGAVFDATFNVFFKVRYDKVYEGVLSTPLGPFDIAWARSASVPRGSPPSGLRSWR